MTLPDMNPLLIFPVVLAVLVIWAVIRELRSIDRKLKRTLQRSESARKGWATRKSRTFTPPKL